MKLLALSLTLALSGAPFPAFAQQAPASPRAPSADGVVAAPVTITIDASQVKGELRPFWAWFGYDEPNYTTTANGKQLLSDLAKLSPVPVFVRAHNLMSSGDGSYALKWGSTNMYREGPNGEPIYDWTIVDQIFDAYVQRGMKPLAQIGFMPKDLSPKPEPYQHQWKPGVPYEQIMTGWAYPPKDYDKWSELIYQWVRHCVERYGQKEVESWYWELWNEPDGHYLIAPDPQKEFNKMYDYAAHAVKRALPTARMGGPHTAGQGAFYNNFIKHVLYGTNHVTGKQGSPIDFLAFHAKGSPKVVDGRVQMNMGIHLQRIHTGLKGAVNYPETRQLPVIIGESDPEGCAACGMATNPENAYRNGTMYASYTAASIAREYDLMDETGANLIGVVNWSFLFEDQPWFAGFRDLATNGVNKPVLNVFRMLGMMEGQRIKVGGDLAYNVASIRSGSVRGQRTDINALAAKGKKGVTVLVWNYHDNDVIDAGAPVTIELSGLTGKRARMTHYRIDQARSNSYTAWKAMGSPQAPTAQQVAALKKASELATLGAPSTVAIKDGKATLRMQLPRQAVSLIKLDY